MRKPVLLFLVLLLPLFVPLLLVAKTLHEFHVTPTYKVKITGYDPRDMLRGHYLVFRYDWQWMEGQKPQDADDFMQQWIKGVPQSHPQDRDLCLSGDRERPLATLVSPREPARKLCAAVIKPRHRKGDWGDIGLNRYYIPQAEAVTLERQLRSGEADFHVRLGVRPDGSAFIRDLVIEKR